MLFASILYSIIEERAGPGTQTPLPTVLPPGEPSVVLNHPFLAGMNACNSLGVSV